MQYNRTTSYSRLESIISAIFVDENCIIWNTHFNLLGYTLGDMNIIIFEHVKKREHKYKERKGYISYRISTHYFSDWIENVRVKDLSSIILEHRSW